MSTLFTMTIRRQARPAFVGKARERAVSGSFAPRHVVSNAAANAANAIPEQVRPITLAGGSMR